MPRRKQASKGWETSNIEVTLAIAVFAIALVSAQFFVTAGYDIKLKGPTPVIGNVQASPTYNSVTITWNTFVLSSSQVFYATSNYHELSEPNLPYEGYDHQTPITDTLNGVGSHSVTITGLESNTTYYYYTKSVAVLVPGDPGKSADKLTFTTPNPPCSGTLTFDLSPGTVQTGAAATATVGGLSYCTEKNVFVYPGQQCNGTAACSFGITGDGTGGSCQFNAPSTNGTYTYIACTDMDGDSSYSASEKITDTLAVTAPPQQNQTNQTQPSQPSCGNNLKETGEECDGYDFGGQSCPSGTTGNLRCLSCRIDRSNCQAPKCGNGVIDTGEECDGTKLGGKSCMSMGYTGGMLSCSQCFLNTAGCTAVPIVSATDAQTAIVAAQAAINASGQANKNVTEAVNMVNLAISSFNAIQYEQARNQALIAKDLALNAPELQQQQQMPVVLIGVAGVIIATGAAAAVYLLKFMPKKGAGIEVPPAPPPEVPPVPSKKRRLKAPPAPKP